MPSEPQLRHDREEAIKRVDIILYSGIVSTAKYYTSL
jgi:hypothetical protein